MCKELERLSVDGVYNIISLIIPKGYIFCKLSPISIYIRRIPKKKPSSIESILINFREYGVVLVSEDNQLEEYFSWLYTMFSLKLDSLNTHTRFYYLDLKEGLEDD